MFYSNNIQYNKIIHTVMLAQKDQYSSRISFVNRMIIILIIYQSVFQKYKQSTMQPPQISYDHRKLETMLQAYGMFSSNQSYQQKCALFKTKIQNDDQFIIKVVVNAMRNILTYRQITSWREVFKIQKITKENILFQAYNSLNLSEFSKLLVLRFLRETYFESNYLFVNYVNIQLSDVLLKIGQFKKQSRDDERGRYMFYPQSKLFTNLNQQEATKKIDKQIETIGFSIHKLTLEILFTCPKLSQYLPFHEEFVSKEKPQLNESFDNGLYKVYKRLADQSIKFPSKFHYFKQKDVTKFANEYKKIFYHQKISRLFTSIFEQVWSLIQSTINDGLKQNDSKLYLFAVNQLSSVNLQDKIDFCRKLVWHTCDRYFWKYFTQFLIKMFSQFQSKRQLDESLTQKQMKNILEIHLFILFFNHHLLQPQIMHLIDCKYVKQLARLFLIVLRYYCKSQGNASCKHVLNCILFCFRKMKQLSLQFKHHFHNKMSNDDYYPFISLYADIILQTETNIQSKMVKFDEPAGKLEKSIIERMHNNHQLYIKKQKFIQLFYKRQNQIDLKQTKKNYQQSVKAILNQYEKLITFGKASQQLKQVEYINIEKQSIQQQEIQINPNKSTLNSIKIRNSYRINVMGGQRRYYSEDKNIPNINSATSSPLSFVQSLKVNVSKPNEALVKSLSSSRKLKRMNQKSSSHIKSFSSNELSQLGQSVSIQKQAQSNALPPFSVPPEFKQVFVQSYETSLFQKSTQNLSNPIKNSIKRVANVNRNNNLVARKYINNFIEQNMTQAKRQSANEASLYSLRIQQDPYQISSLQNKMVPSSTNTSDKNFRRKDCKDKAGSYARSIKQLETQQVISSKQSIQQLKLRQQNSTETQMCFYFTPKAKKQLLKKKILVRKQGSLQVGMIVNLQEDIRASQLSTIKRYAISIKIFISALVALQKVNVNIKFPNWLECISKANTAKEGMKEQTQFIASFIVQLKSSRERIIKRNYGELPLITVVYLDRSDKKQIISEPLYILPNRFSVEKTFSQEELSGLLEANYKVSMPFLVHERIAGDIKSMRQYFPSLTMHNLQASEKMQLFEMQEMIVGDQIGVVKLQFVKNNQQMMLIFLEGKMESSNNARPAIGRCYLFVQLHALRQQKWSYEQLHIFQTCLRSILCADK